jgi:hypothetical protein
MDPTLALTFDDFRIRVAEYLGVADTSGGAAALPVDAGDLDLVSRLVNDGYRRFLRDYRWNFMSVPFSLTFGTGRVGSDNARYYLPDDFGALLDPFTYDTNGPSIDIRQVPEESIRSYQAGGSTSGQPVMFAVRPINVTNTATGQRWEAVFWPTPTGTETVTARYRRWPGKFTTGTNRSVAGFMHDQTVLDAALAAAELDRNDTIGVREAAYQRSYAMSRAEDARLAPSRIASYGDTSDLSRGSFRTGAVDTYNGGAV